uniref:Uncharacterized protein n=1 Tax=Anguilla anguilla TaxID=7936 RepID=A0A0E9V1S4_ANGAN
MPLCSLNYNEAEVTKLFFPCDHFKSI